MIYEQLVEAYDNAGAGDQWRSFAQAVIAAVRAAEARSVDAERLVDGAAVLWEGRPHQDAIRLHKEAVWNFLESKNGDTTTIRDADDRALRALLGALEPDGDRSAAEEAAEWVETFLTGFGA